MFLVVRSRFKVSCITFYTVRNGLSFSEMRARADLGLTLTGPSGLGQGCLRVDQTSRARARASKIGQGLAQTDPWTV